MHADTKTIAIAANPRKIVSFLADPANLPRWAVGFAKSVREDNGRWYVHTANGELGIRIASEETTGVVDFWMTPAPGVEVLAASRVLPNGDGGELVFTQFQTPGMSHDAFSKSVKALEHELTVLKAIVEVECPL